MASFLMLKAAMPLVYLLAGLTLAATRPVEHPAHFHEVPLEPAEGIEDVPVPAEKAPGDPAEDGDE